MLGWSYCWSWPGQVSNQRALPPESTPITTHPETIVAQFGCRNLNHRSLAKSITALHCTVVSFRAWSSGLLHVLVFRVRRFDSRRIQSIRARMMRDGVPDLPVGKAHMKRR